ncbi:MAG: bifunctional UDP-sugar hydrolase/5'-nucleotidase [Rikenellaceae bacterium]
MKLKIFAALALLAGGLFFYCDQRATTEIVVLSTNDVHASIGGSPRLATFVKEMRAENENVLVMDGGDFCSGNPYVDMAEHRGEPIIDLMNIVGYDVITLGNHEFDYNVTNLKRNLDRLNADVLCANADFSRSVLRNSVKPYKIVEVGGVRMAILGLIELTDLGVPSTLPANVSSIKFRDGIEVSQEYRFLRDSADLVVGLTHLGYQTDSLMVCVNDMFDLIVGGHSHTHITEGRTINGTVVTQSGSRLDNVGVTRIKVKRGKVKSIVNETVSLAGYEPDSVAAAYVERVTSDSPLNQPIGKLDVALDKTGLKNLITDAVRKRSRADIALQNSGSIRIDKLEAGDVTSANIYSLDPFGNHIVTQRLTLAQIKELLMTNYKRPHAKSTDLSPSGMTYRVIMGADGVVTDIECFDMDGKPMVDGKLYRMATNNYVSSAYIYEGQNKASKLGLAPVKIAEVVIDAFKATDVYNGDNTERAVIVRAE